MQWNPATAWHEVEVDDVEGTSGVYAELLDQCPVARVTVDGSSVGFWGVFAYDELAQATTNHKSFSNVTPPPEGPRILPLQSDPPEHASYRRMLNRFFSVEAVSKVEEVVRPYAIEIIDAMVARREADFSEELAYPFPTRVLCSFLRVPDEDWTVHHDWVMKMEDVTGDGLLEPDNPVPEALVHEILPYLGGLIATRRAALGDDVVSGILMGEIDGKPLDDTAVVFLIITLMLAGHITTTSGVNNLVLRLARDPELQSFLRSHPERIPDAVEESIRLDTPQQAMPRKCVHDTEIGGETIRAGEFVLMNFGSANVDPKRWTHPETFDVDRSDKAHVGFGRGVHKCIGAPLARMEMRIVLEELLARTESFSLAGDVRRRAWPRLGVDSMPIALVPRG